MLRPLGDRVLIRPEQNPDVTASGLLLPETRSETYLEMRGTVVAVGQPVHPLKADAEMLAEKLDEYNRWDLGEDEEREGWCAQAADMIRDLVRREPCVRVGDDVIFSWAVGQQITIDDETFLLLRESDLLAVVEAAAR